MTAEGWPQDDGVRSHVLPHSGLTIEQGTFKTFQSQYPELEKLLITGAHETRFKGESFDMATTHLIESFQKGILPKLPKNKQMEMNQLIQLYHIGSLSEGMLVKRIQELSKEQNFFFNTPNVLKPELKHAQTLSSIKGTKLFHELEALEDDLRDALPKTQEEQALLNDFHHLNLLKAFTRLELTHKDWEVLKTKKPSQMFVSMQGGDPNEAEAIHGRHPERSEGSQRFFGLRPQNDKRV
jgi:hypothetical protein